MFFKAKPNLGDNEKAKIEFFFDRVARCLGTPRITSSVVRLDDLMSLGLQEDSVPRIRSLVANHLSHNCDDIVVKLAPKLAQKCGGGG